MITNKPTKAVFIIVVVSLLLSIAVSMADLIGPTPDEIKTTLISAGIRNGVTFSAGGQTYVIENITVSKEVGNRYAVRFNTYLP